MKFVIVSGLAGSGKSVALGMLEDLGYYCIDNLPLSLLKNVTEGTFTAGELRTDRLAIGMDARSRPEQIGCFPEGVAARRAAGMDIQVIYLEANAEVILRRYSETRRKHPLSDGQTSLVDAVTADRELMRPIAADADLVIDTSHTTIHQLREQIRTRVGSASESGLSVLLQSFGFKYGVPDAVDFVFDVRCLSNPNWEPELKPLTGLDRPVADFLEQTPQTPAMLRDIGDFILRWLPEFAREYRAYITIAVGCTGGRHRSVYLAQKLAERLREAYPRTLVRHTELP